MPLDWLWCGDDVAGQQSMVMSPRAGGSRSSRSSHGMWVANHCCGALRPIISDLIEIGFEVAGIRARLMR